MRVSDIVNLGLEYLMAGVVFLIIIGIGFAVWYLAYFKKKHPNDKIRTNRIILAGAFFLYLVVVLGATMLSRAGFYGNTKIYPLFYSYKDAWTDFSLTEWRNIILNILMFVPFGIFLPLLFKIMQKFWKVYLAGLGLTLLIEILQLLLKRGIFEPDDILGNTVGAMIGYGVYCLGRYMVQWLKYKRKEKGGQVFCLQLPLLFTVVAFGAIFLVYHAQELGNLDCTYLIKQKNISVSSEVEFKQETAPVVVYQADVLSVSETEELAKDLFARQNCDIDESRTDIYENTALYYSAGENRFSVWFDYDGGTFHMTDFERIFADEDGQNPIKADASEDEIRKAFSDAGIYVPESAEFENKGDGIYCFRADKITVGDVMYDGVLEGTYYAAGKFGRIENGIVEFVEYKEAYIISEEEAYRELKEGKFSYWRADDSVLNVRVEAVILDYRMDTKGFYQPVYNFEAFVNERQTEIVVPAIK